MSRVYFPSCKYTAHSPESSQKIQKYLSERHEISMTGCCGPNHGNLTEKDTAVYICCTCGAFLEEDAPQVKSVSVWEILQDDADFPWPDYHGEKMTVQDCWRVYDNRPQQDAVRSVLKRMHIDVVDIADCFDKTNFCGVSLLTPVPQRSLEFAPVRFGENAKNKFLPHTEEEQKKMMEKHCKQFVTDKVICYCIACLGGLKLGNAHALHLMDLLALCL